MRNAEFAAAPPIDLTNATSGSLTQHPPPRGVELTIVVPTFSERENVGELVERIRRTLQGVSWEIVFVDDDSPDGTADAIRNLAAVDARVRCLQRIGRRGLSSACVEGMLSSSAPYLAVMDADLQHDEAVLPRMLAVLREEDVDIVVGSRYVEGGSLGEWGQSRVKISKLATRISQLVVPANLHDPMSGFFMLKREVFKSSVRSLSAIGFKILVDLFASHKPALRFKEIPYTFKPRTAGESKLDGQAVWDYAMLLLDKMIGHLVPVRFVSFAVIGGLGVGVHMLVLSSLFITQATDFVSGQAAATGVAMVFNFAVNNLLTYRDRRLRGARWLKGLLSFVVVCSVGAFANVGVANYLFAQSGGWIAAALSGILVGAVWNYAVSSVYTWGGSKKR